MIWRKKVNDALSVRTYESFKRAVWDDGFAERKPWPGPDDTPPPLKVEDFARATNHVAMSKKEHLRCLSRLDAQTVEPGGRWPKVVALASPHPPTLLEAHRSQMIAAGKVASFPWLVVLLIGLAVSFLLGFVATGHMVNLHRLGIILGLNE